MLFGSVTTIEQSLTIESSNRCINIYLFHHFHHTTFLLFYPLSYTCISKCLRVDSTPNVLPYNWKFMIGFLDPGGSQKGSMKQGLSALPSLCLPFCPSVCPGGFLELYHQFFSKFCLGARNSYEVVRDRAQVSRKKFLPQKWAKNRVFLNLLRSFVFNFC